MKLWKRHARSSIDENEIILDFLSKSFDSQSKRKADLFLDINGKCKNKKILLEPGSRNKLRSSRSIAAVCS